MGKKKCHFPTCVKNLIFPIPDPGKVDSEDHDYAEDVMTCVRESECSEHATCGWNEETRTCWPKNNESLETKMEIDWSSCGWAKEEFVPDPCSTVARYGCELFYPHCVKEDKLEDGVTQEVCVRNETAFPKHHVMPPGYAACVSNATNHNRTKEE